MRTTTLISNNGDGGLSPVAWSYRRWVGSDSPSLEIRVMLCFAFPDCNHWLVFVHFLWRAVDSDSSIFVE